MKTASRFNWVSSAIYLVLAWIGVGAIILAATSLAHFFEDQPGLVGGLDLINGMVQNRILQVAASILTVVSLIGLAKGKFRFAKMTAFALLAGILLLLAIFVIGPAAQEHVSKFWGPMPDQH